MPDLGLMDDADLTEIGERYGIEHKVPSNLICLGGKYCLVVRKPEESGWCYETKSSLIFSQPCQSNL